MKRTKILFLFLGILFLGWLIGRITAPSSNQSESHAHSADHAAHAHEEESEYTCSMHPQIRQPNPGKCPICAMELIPANKQSQDDSGPREVSLSEYAKSLARIVTTPVVQEMPEVETTLFGRVLADESRIRSISARFPARIERLYVNYTGVQVTQGDHLAKIYSPELLTAQTELLSAKRFNDERALLSAREKLSLWGLPESAISMIESNEKPSDTMDIDAPLSGFITEKLVNDGDYVETGEALFKITDLSTVWVVLDAYEMDKPWLRFGQPVTFTAEALPGQTFEGRISFISPVLDPDTRTFKVRVNIPNENLHLQPGMFVTGKVHSHITGEGTLLDPELEGKWISPMHPEIIKDAPGKCDVCGMDLVPASKLGYASATEGEAPLLIPTSAVLHTGRRSLVYVELPDKDRPTYEGREIILGPRAGDAYIVISGLEAGEQVVTNGAFKIDSALQLLAKPSMMSPSDERTHETIPRFPDAPDEIKNALATLTSAYFPLWRALAADDLPKAKTIATTLEKATHKFHDLSSKNDLQNFFEETLKKLSKFSLAISQSEDIDTARQEFEHVSNSLIQAVRAISLPDSMTVYLAFCPMTFEGRKSDWLQDDDDLLNPYFGASMLHCGGFEDLHPSDNSPHADHSHGTSH